ncbi:MAG: TrkH family potassium uptake protein [bacterium]
MKLFRSFRIIKGSKPEPPWFSKFFWATTGFVAFTVLVFILLQGYRLPIWGIEGKVIQICTLLATLLTLTEIIIHGIFFLSRQRSELNPWLLLIFGFTLLVTLFLLPFLSFLVILLYRSIALGHRLSQKGIFFSLINRMRQQAVISLVLSFAIIIALGTLFLTFPAATTDGRGMPFLDALFTATSATCVTGLIVRDTGSYFTTFGQVIILLLIQLGGLGIMTFSTSVAIVLGHRLAPAERRLVAEMVETPREIDIARMIRYIFLFTILAESLGCLVLFLRWMPQFSTLGLALYHALFHSISAFCNAGFSTFNDSLISYQSDSIINITFILLIVLGGLGFAVVNELFRKRPVRYGIRFTVQSLTVHSRLVLTTTIILIFTGALLFFFLEYDRSLSQLPTGTKLLASLFQSVTARTAGFNTIPMHSLHPATVLIITILMFIGASPGGTGGGIKTTTFTVLILALRARILNQEDIVFGGRTIDRDVVFRALAIAIAACCVVTVGLLTLLAIEKHPFQVLLFETVSAFGTVGLSTGITSALNVFSRLVIITLMFTGRLGPLTLAMAMATPKTRLSITYPQARIMVG